MTAFLPGAWSSRFRRFASFGVVLAVVLGFIIEGRSWVRWGPVWSSTAMPVEMVLATGADKWNRAARESLNAWNQAGANFRFTSTTSSGDEAASCSSGAVDRRNVVVFASTVCGDSWSATAIAITKVWYSSSTNVTVDADVLFNADYDWDVYRGPARSDVPDFRRVALHEFGHVLGLDHPDDHGQLVDAIMNSRASDLDVLQVDDKEGARALYGPSSTVRPDLVVVEVRLSESVASPGERLDITATVQNTGSGRSPVTTLEYLSRRQGGAWELFDVDVVNGLAASGTSTESTRFSAPSQPGVYQYQVCVERVDREQDATNNCSRHLTLEVRDDPPDLAVTSLTVSTAELDPRESFVLSAEVVNLGGETTPPTRLRYRRRSAGRSWTDVGSVPVRSISSGATATRRLDMVAPATAGAYEYSACVSEVAGEIDTANNCSVSVRVDVRVPCVVEPLGSAQRERRVAASWAGACISTRGAPPGVHARYYSFSVPGGRPVRIGLSSPVHGSLHLRRGQAVDGSLVTSASGADPRIVRTLSSGTYTVEVLPLQAGVTAAFVLRVGVRQPFVDDPLQVGDPIRAVHVTELRERIDILRGTAGLTRFRWTDPTIVRGVTPVRAVHLTELHTALNEVYLADGRPGLPSAHDIRVGVPIAADHFNAVRRALEAL